MPRETTDNLELKDYLLGSIDTGAQEKIEERLMTDDEFFEELLAVEEDLIQDYVDEDLTPDEAARFETHFLINEERREKLEFARTLRRNIEAQSTEENVRETTPEKPLNFFQRIFASPIPATAGLLIIFGLSALLIWNFFLRSNDADTALASLNKAYQTERPLESRISQFDYAPLKNTRGGDDSKIDPLQLDIAKTESLKPASENPTAENLHAAGRFYLTQKEFDNAIAQLEKAERLNADNAEIQNDLGVAYLEKSLLSVDNAERIELNEKSLGKFDRAIELDPDFLAALFNKAITLQNTPLPKQAKKTWEDYLKLDPSSQWANEAKKNLEKLETKTTGELDADTLEEEFIKTLNDNDEERAFQLVSQNRELIREKYLPQRLAISFVSADEDKRAGYLEALKYLGQIESRRFQDNFASDLADYYESAPAEKIDVLKNAQDFMRRGYASLLKSDFNTALENFSNARESFFLANNIYEANTVTAILVGYCLNSTKKNAEALDIFEQVDKFTKKHKYIWLNSLNSYWMIGVESNLGKKTYLEAKTVTENNLETAKKIGDLFLTQTLLLTLALQSSFVSQNRETRSHLAELFQYSGLPNVSLRQKMRNYGIGTEILVKIGSRSLSKAVVLEGLSVSEETKDKPSTLNSQINSGIVHTLAGDYQNGERWLQIAKQNAPDIKNPATKEAFLSKIHMYLGHLYRTKKDYVEAAKNYDEALDYLKTDLPARKFEIQKSRLLAYQESENYVEVEKQLPDMLKLAEKYRSEILEEQESNSFFDNEHTIYEIAVENELRKGNIEEAYNFAEFSRSRSLLDWLQKGAKVINEAEKVQIIFQESSEPLELKEIQKRISERVQILQYTILDDVLLIWLIDRENFEFYEQKIESDLLKQQVDSYMALIRNNEDENEQRELAGILYQQLIEPISSKLDSSKQIAVIPDKFLFSLPFISLIDPKGDYFIENHISFYSPSANVLILSSENASAKSDSGDDFILSIGNPNFDKQEFPNLQDLPDAEKEAKEISVYYKRSKLLTGDDATKRAFLEESKNADIIHFAGHYVVENGLPLSSGLVMAKEETVGNPLLTNAGLISEKFPNTKLIILSACETTFEDFYRGEGLIGLSRTFLAAKVPVVVGSQWKVDSEATARLMSNFHQQRQQKKFSTVESLRLTQIELINSDTQNKLPYFWSGFGVIGGFADY